VASGAPLLPVPLAGAGFRVFRDRTTPPSLRPEGTLSWSSSPLQSTTGVHCPSGFRRLRPHRLSPALGSASPEVPRPYDALSSGAPLCHDRFDRSQETRDTTPSSGSVLGFSQPLDGFSRDCATSPSCPEPTVPPSLRPEASRPCYMPQASLGFTLQSFPLPRSRPTSSVGSSSLRVRRRPFLRREGPSAVRPVSAALRAPASPGAPREEDVPFGHESGRVASPRSSRPSVHPTSCPVKRPRRPTGDLRARRLTAVSPASKLCSPRESVLATDRALPPDSRPKVLSRPTGPVLSWVFAPSEFSPSRPRVRQTATTARHAERSRKSKPRSGQRKLRASILRPRPSGTSGGVRVAARSPRRRTLRASAPPYGGAPSSRALSRSAQPWPPGSVGLQRFKAVTVGRSHRARARKRPASSHGVLCLLTLPPRLKARATPGL
jgi:hypothetical protein